MKNELKKEVKTKMKNKSELKEKVRKACEEHPFFGYRRIDAILRYKYGVRARRNTIYTLIKEMGLQLPPTRSNRKSFKGVPMNHNLEALTCPDQTGPEVMISWA
jgi:transposase